MSAYVIVNVDVVDAQRYAEYAEVAPVSIEAQGGRYLVRGGRAEILEGGWQPKRVVVLEFESFDAAKAWWASEEYRSAKVLRQACAKTEMILVEGVPAVPTVADATGCS